MFYARAVTAFADGFAEEPGYLDYAAFGPLSRGVAAEIVAQTELMTRARYGAERRIRENVDRMRTAAARLTGFRDDQIVFSPSTTDGIMQVVFGVTGGILVSRAEYPSLPTAAVRASESLRATAPIWLETDHGLITPGAIREQLTSTTSAVAVSAIDARTGHLVDLEGIRDVIGDRLLIVDAVQAFGVVDAPWQVADVIATGGQKWLRAGWGSGFLAISDRAAYRLTAVISGPDGVPGGDLVWDEVPEPAQGAEGFRTSRADPLASARLATALEEVSDAGIAEIAAAARTRAGEVIALADEYGLQVTSPRADAERGGIVVVRPPEEHFTALSAALVNHGISATSGRARCGSPRTPAPRTRPSGC